MAKKVVKKGKKPHKNKPTSKKYTKYKIEGNKIKNFVYPINIDPLNFKI